MDRSGHDEHRTHKKILNQAAQCKGGWSLSQGVGLDGLDTSVEPGHPWVLKYAESQEG